jgi:peptide/nickel transport system permease protein
MTSAPVTAPGARRPGGVRALADNLWVRFIVRRLLGLIAVIVALIVGVFWVMQLIPGDPVTNALGLQATPIQVNRIKHENGYDLPAFEQFTRYIRHLSHGDMGQVFNVRQPVSELIAQRIGPSLELAGTALALVLFTSIPLGLLAGALTREGRHRKLELMFTSTTSTLGAVPELLIATVLVFVFAVQLRWLPVAGAGGFETLILPALSVAIGPAMILARIVRIETLGVLAQDYIRTARAKQLPSATLFFRHVLPNVLTAALTIAGLLFAALIGGTVIVENVFARPGLGSALVNGVLSKEYSQVQGIVLVIGITVVVVNAVVDVLLATLDPRSLARHA